MTAPTVHLYEFNIKKSSPAPVRHVAGGSEAYVKTLGSGVLANYLEFDGFIEQVGGWYSAITKVLIFRTSSENYRITNMRYYSPDQSALSAGSSHLQFAVSGSWAAYPHNATSGQVGMISVPSTIPVSQNLFQQNGSANLSGIIDANVSQYIYLSLILDDEYPSGRYGSGESTSFGRFESRVIFDFFTP
jgi:hypothetical protein